MAEPLVHAEGLDGYCQLWQADWLREVRVLMDKRGSLGRGAKSKIIPLSRVGAIEFEPAGLERGHIRFVLRGMASDNDENEVVFTTEQQPEFEKLKAAVQERLPAMAQPQASSNLDQPTSAARSREKGVTLGIDTSFPCLIADKPLTRHESLVVGMTTGGAFRGTFRRATASFEGNEVTIRARTDPLAGATEVVAAKMPIWDIAEVRMSQVPIDDQFRAALVRFLIVSAGFALAVGIGVAIKLGSSLSGGNWGALIAFCIIAGLCLGGIFSLPASLNKLERNLTQVLLVTSDDKGIVLAVKAADKGTAMGVFRAHGLKISGYTAVADLAARPKQERTCGNCGCVIAGDPKTCEYCGADLK